MTVRASSAHGTGKKKKKGLQGGLKGVLKPSEARGFEGTSRGLEGVLKPSGKGASRGLGGGLKGA